MGTGDKVERSVSNTDLRNESERHYRALFEAMTDGLVVAEAILDDVGIVNDFRIIDVNPSYVRQTGLDRASIVGRSCSEALDLAERLPLFLRVLESGEPTQFESVHPTSGRLARVTVTTPIEGRLAFVFDDITERERVRRLAERYAALGETHEAIVRAADEQDLFQRVCDVAIGIEGIAIAWLGVHDPASGCLVRRVVGLSPGCTLDIPDVPLQGSPTFSLLGTSFLGERIVCINDLMADVRSAPLRPFELHGIAAAIALPLRKSGKTCGVLGIGAREVGYFDEEVERLLTTIADNLSFGWDALTTTRGLRASEERYRSLLEKLDDVVFTLDTEGKVTFVSPAIARLGVQPSDVLGLPFVSRMAPHIAATAEREVALALSGRSTSFELDPNSSVSGRKLFLRVSLQPDLAEDGTVIGLRGLLTDLTRQHETEEQLRSAQKMEAVGRLAGGVAHDFNNLLGVIGGYTALALESISRGDPLYEDLSEVEQATRRAAALTQQLLAFSRKQVLVPTIVDITELVTNVQKMLRPLLGEDISLTFVPGLTVGTTTADPGQMEQALVNLAINARDAMPNGGALTIHAADVTLDTERARLIETAPGPTVMIAVSDTGSGMDLSTQHRIFEPFFTTKGPGKGTGLGLAMVYGFVKQTGGGIEVESAIGKGTTFRIFLPKAGRAETRPSTIPPPRQRAAAGETILLVEDDDALRKLVHRMLVTAGYEILVASNPGDALLLAEKFGSRIGLLLSDVVMPTMSGPELAKRLSLITPRMKVLFMSGYSDEAVAEQWTLNPGASLLNKPFSHDRLNAKIREAFDAAPSSR